MHNGTTAIVTKDQWCWDTGVVYLKRGDSVSIVEIGRESARVRNLSGRVFTVLKKDIEIKHD